MIETGDIIIDEMFGGNEFEIVHMDDDGTIHIGAVGARDEWEQAIADWEAKQEDNPLADHTENTRPEMPASHYDRDYFDQSWQAGRFHYPEDSDKEYTPQDDRRSDEAGEADEDADAEGDTSSVEETSPDAADVDADQSRINEATSW